MNDWEFSGRFEVKDYTYRFTIGIDECVFECSKCGALVSYLTIPKHNHFHSLLNVVFNVTAPA